MSDVCPKQQKLNLVDATGHKETVRQCIEPTSPSFAHHVTPEVCEACPVRAAVVASANKRQPNKPERVATKHVSQPLKKETDCADLKQRIRVKCCGEVVRTNYCHSISSQYNGQIVTPQECGQCPARRVAS